MATVSKEIAEQIANAKGNYPGDPQCYSVLKYYNETAKKECYALTYNMFEHDQYHHEHVVLEVLFHKIGGRK